MAVHQLEYSQGLIVNSREQHSWTEQTCTARRFGWERVKTGKHTNLVHVQPHHHELKTNIAVPQKAQNITEDEDTRGNTTTKMS